MDRRDLIFVILVVLVGVSALSVLTYMLWPDGSMPFPFGFLPFIFLFFPIIIPLSWRGKGSARVEDPDDYCPGCGCPLDPEYDFCTVCGRRIRRCRDGSDGRCWRSASSGSSARRRPS